MSVSPNSTAHSLVERYRSYAEAVVNRLMKSLGVPRSLYDELVGAAYLGLVEASERFDVKRGSEFKPYAFMRIRGAVIDCMRQNSYFSGRAYRYIKVLHGINDYQQLVTAAEEGSVKNAADELATIIDFAASGAIAFQLSLDEQDSDVSRLHPGLVNPEKVFEEKQTEAILREIIATLEPRERMIIEEYYFNDKSFVEIADTEEGLSKSWISRLHGRALETLKKRMLEKASAVRTAGDRKRMPRNDSARPKRRRRKSNRNPSGPKSSRGKKKDST